MPFMADVQLAQQGLKHDPLRSMKYGTHGDNSMIAFVPPPGRGLGELEVRGSDWLRQPSSIAGGSFPRDDAFGPVSLAKDLDSQRTLTSRVAVVGLNCDETKTANASPVVRLPQLR